MFRFLLATIFISFVDMSLFAYQVINVKTEITPGCDGGILCERIEELQFDLFCHISGVSVTTDARASSTNGKIGEYLKLSSSHSYTICNNTHSAKFFKVETKLSTHDYKEFFEEKTYYLNPEQAIRVSRELYLNNEYHQAGTFQICACTIVSGDASSSSKDYKTVTIW